MSLKKYIYYPLLFLISFVVFYVLCNASISMVVFPFAPALLFSSLFVSLSVWPACFGYLLAGILYNTSFEGVVSTAVSAACAISMVFVHIFLKNKPKLWECLGFCAFSQIGKILFSVLNGQNYYFDFISMGLSVLLCYVFSYILKVLLLKQTSKLSVLECVSGSALLIALSDGLVEINFFSFSFLKLFVALAILVTAYSVKGGLGIFLSVILGLGTLLGRNNAVFVAPFVMWGVSVALFKTYRKYLMPVALLLCESLCGFYFDLYYEFNYLSLLPVVVACLIFLCVPSKVYDKTASLFDLKNKRIAVKEVVNRNREMLTRRIKSLGMVFEDMDKLFRSGSRKNLSKESMKEVLNRGVKNGVCEKCPEKDRCYRSYQNQMREVLSEVGDVAYEKGKINILDIPPFLNAHCKNVTSIISSVNSQCAQYKRYSELVGNVDLSKTLIADQFFGVSEIMKKLAKEIEKPVSFDSVREKKILDELAFNNIRCEDVVVFEKDIHSLDVSLLVKVEDKDEEKITSSVENVCGQKMFVSDRFVEKPGYASLILKNMPKMDCNFGISQKTKDGEMLSGDCYSVQKLDDGRFMFAVCDGMGSGENAQKMSENAITLLENFYKAGFDGEIAIKSVNKVLSIEKEECFSAIDICVLDLNNGVLDFVKMGSPSSFLLKKEVCEIVEGGALPLGVINNSQPSAYQNIVNKGDFLILVSDGVSDSFENDQEMCEKLCALNDKNPQTISDKILEMAIKNNNNLIKDDMTVLVVNIF